MYCKYCGKQLSDGVVFCTQCGQLVDDEISKQLAIPQPDTMPSEPTKRKNPIALVGFILSIVGSALSVISLIATSAEFMFLFAAVALAGLVCSAVGLGLSKSRGSGKGFALAGVITAAIVLAGILLLLLLAFFAVYGFMYILFLLLLGAAA